MKEHLIGFETAKLAKEKGFDERCSNVYHDGTLLLNFGIDVLEGMDPNNYDLYKYVSDQHYTVPTQSFLQKWLRDEFNIIVEVGFDTISFGYRIFNPFLSEDNFSNWKYNKWDYESALEVGLIEALKLIKL